MSRAAGGSGTGALPVTLTSLIRKDLDVFRLRDRVLVAFIYLMASLQAVVTEESFFLLNVGLAGALSTWVVVVEWFQETDPMLHSLPVRRSTVVLARYLAALGAAGVAGVAWVGTGWALRPLLASNPDAPAMWSSLEGISTFLLAVCLLISLFLPLFFRFGLGRSVLAFLGLSPVLLVAGYGTAGMAWGPLGEAPVGLPIVPPSSLISSRVSALVAGVGPGLALAVILVGIGLLMTFSGHLSVRFQEKRDF